MTSDMSTESTIRGLILRASSDEATLNALLGQHRPYLRLMVENAIHDGYRRREDASDIVQKTMLESYEDFGAFRGNTEEEFSAWVLQILRRNVVNAIRDQLAAKRDIRRERYLDSGDGSVSLFWWHVAPEQSTPSHRVLKAEAALNLAEALEQLPEPQRQAVRMRHLEGASLQEICEVMDRTPASIAGLLRRGLANLRATFDADDVRP